jgi:Domain of unknown function (DUF4915)
MIDVDYRMYDVMRVRARCRFEPIAFCPGFLRGLAVYGDYAIAGLSKPRRERTFSGLVLDERLKEKDSDARCGLWVVDLRSGRSCIGSRSKASSSSSTTSPSYPACA